MSTRSGAVVRSFIRASLSALLIGVVAIAWWILAVAGLSWDRLHAVLLAAAGVCGLVGLWSRRRREALALGLALLAVALAWDPFRSWLAPGGMGRVTSLYHELTIGAFPWGPGARAPFEDGPVRSAVHTAAAAWMLRGHVAALLLAAAIAGGLLSSLGRRWRAAVAFPVVAGLACSGWAMLRAGYPTWSAEVTLYALRLPAAWEAREELLLSSLGWGHDGIQADYGILTGMVTRPWQSGLVVAVSPWGRAPTVALDRAGMTAVVGLPRGGDGPLDAVAALQAGIAARHADPPEALAQPWRACFAIASTVRFAEALPGEELDVEAWLAEGAGGWWGHPWVAVLLDLQADCGARAVGRVARRARFEPVLDDVALDRMIAEVRGGTCIAEPEIAAARAHLPEVP